MSIEVSKTQYQLLTCSADWVLFGGAAGGGKSYGLMLDALRHAQGPYAQPLYRGAFFRWSFPQLKVAGGLIDQTKLLYSQCGADYNHTNSEHRFPCGAKISLNTLQNEEKLEGYKGAQFDSLMIDEADQFTQRQVLFLWGRCRSQCGIRPTLRMTANPNHDSWLFPLVQWYLDDSGYPDESKSGVVRHFLVENERFLWFDEPQYQKHLCLTNSFTFIPSKLSDNTFLERSDPSYRQRLMQLNEQERERFLGGCWFASSKGDTEWPRELFFDVQVDEDQWPSPKHQHESVRMFAVDPSKGRHTKQGDFSAITCMLQMENGLKYVDSDMQRRPPGQIVEDLFRFCDDPLHRIQSGDMLGIEATAFQELLQNLVYQYAADNPNYALSQWLLAGNILIPVEDQLNKKIRIRRLDRPIRNRLFRYLRNPGTNLLLAQLRQWDGVEKKGVHDDGPDSLDMCQQLPIQLERYFERLREG